MYLKLIILIAGMTLFILPAYGKTNKTEEAIVIRNMIFSDELNSDAKRFKHEFQITSFKNKNLYEEKLKVQVFKKNITLDLIDRVWIKDESGVDHDDWPDKKEKYEIYQGKLEAIIGDDRGVVGKSHSTSVTFKYYRASKKGKRPLVFVLPPIAGTSMVDRDVTLSLAKNNVDAVWMDIPNILDETKSIDDVSVILTEYLKAIRMLVGHFLDNTEFEIDQNRVGVFGISMGAGIASILVGIEKRIKYAYIVVGGGNLADIMTHGKQERIVSYREKRLSNDEEFYFLNDIEKKKKWFELIREKFYFDPVYFASNADPSKIYMVIGTHDQVIPFRDQVELWNAFGNPRYTLSRLPHIATVVRWFVHDRHEVSEFIKE